MGPESLTRDQVNYAVWRYLQESGFYDAACKLQRDWLVSNPEELPFAKHVKEHALLSLLQKGLEWCDIENQLPPIATAQGKTIPEYPFGNPVIDPGLTRNATMDAKNGVTTNDAMMIDSDQASAFQFPHPPSPPLSNVLTSQPAPRPEYTDRGINTDPEPEPIDLSASTVVLASTTTTSGPVQHCEWNPADRDCLATVARNALVRIWHVNQQAWLEDDDAPLPSSLALPGTEIDGSRGWYATAVAWDPTGQRLAVGVCDRADVFEAQITVFRSNENRPELSLFTPPRLIVKICWSESGTKLLGLFESMADQEAYLWNGATGDILGTVTYDGNVEDAVWASDSEFIIATLRSVTMYRWTDKGVTGVELVHTFASTSDSIQITIKWDSVLEILAVISNFVILSLYNFEGLIYTNKEAHGNDVTAIAWQPTTKTKAHYDAKPNEPRRLASAAVDGNIRIWNARPPFGRIHEFKIDRYRIHPVGALAFSPDGSLVAGASKDRLSIFAVNTHRTDDYAKAAWKKKGEAVEMDGQMNRLVNGQVNGQEDDGDGIVQQGVVNGEGAVNGHGDELSVGDEAESDISDGNTEVRVWVGWSADGTRLVHAYEKETSVISTLDVIAVMNDD